jgi:XRE family transcriptional regulator, regulator of sulfur utilization
VTGKRFERSHVRSLGRNIRAMREGRNWSLRRVASISGVSVAALQKIEAGASNPSLLTVAAIIDALGGSIDRLISEARQFDQATTIVRGTLKPAASGVVLLSSELKDRRMDCKVLGLAPRQKLDGCIPSNPTFGHVLEGGLQLAFPDGKTLMLSAGDSFHTTADAAVKWSNPLSRRSVVLCINDGETKGSGRRGATG